jgi:plasmid stabilization system protein ParE
MGCDPLHDEGSIYVDRLAISRLSPRADIFEIWSYVANDNVDAADGVEQAIYDACALLACAPLHGHFRPGLAAPKLRFWTPGETAFATCGEQPYS